MINDRIKEEITDNQQKEKEVAFLKTSDAGSQYCCGQVGRGIQPPSTTHTPLPTHITKKNM